jgi:aryl-alcohol dehydrogenase-like predicted oxidoreductase
MKKRVLGRTGHKSTLVSLGGAAAWPNNRKEVDAFIKLALDHGINHIDVAPTYGGGKAEGILGKWVKEYRKNVFLACKTRKRTKKGATKEFNRSLKRLQTDYFDLYQLHCLDDPRELEIALGENGAIHAILEAKEQGLVKYIGITSHNSKIFSRALESFNFDTVLLPVNYILHAHTEPKNDYEPILTIAKKKNIGVIAVKSVAKEPWPKDKRHYGKPETVKKKYKTPYQPFDTQKEVDKALWFTLTQEVTTAASAADVRIAKMMIDAAERFTPMMEEEIQSLLVNATKYRPYFHQP